MRRLLGTFLILFCPMAPATAACPAGAYGSGDGEFVVLAPVDSIPAPGMRYLFRDGRRGSTLDENAAVACSGESVHVRGNGGTQTWPRLPLRETDAGFSSVGTRLAGRLIEPPDETARPLVVMVHGSERTAALASSYAYVLAAQGIRVFVYDKRGTGDSEGEYTQNFELLADDAAAALAEARRLALGRVTRAGYFGGSQGGWVAPLAATRAHADFVAVGFGLVASPIEEDRAQMVDELRAAGLGEDAAEDRANRISRATAHLLASHFTEGYEELANVREQFTGEPWLATLHGEYSGDMLRTDEADLRRVGRARFDNLELIWDYDAFAVLRRLDVPLLWILAEQDREAPIAGTRRALASLADAGKPVDVYLFPDTDHGMVEFTTQPDGSRKITRITDGYLQLLGDWIKGDASGRYGRGKRLNGADND